MKNLISISFLAFIFSALIAACTGQNKLDNASQQQLPTEDSVIVTDFEIVSGRVIEDTVIGYWTVKTTKDSIEWHETKTEWMTALGKRDIARIDLHQVDSLYNDFANNRRLLFNPSKQQ